MALSLYNLYPVLSFSLLNILFSVLHLVFSEPKTLSELVDWEVLSPFRHPATPTFTSNCWNGATGYG